ncbi:MAG: Exo-beta-D-glucosaminidase precursor [Firmicutes bacterium ADurb.Bin419]|nr:MAG: Exo-beta-D-glucosaminidase precursor [Firmicutes bacterium ADurb.Bin419]
MGKYLIYNRAKELGKDISMEEIKEEELYMLLRKVDILENWEKEPVPTMPVYTPTPNQASSNPKETATPGIQTPSVTTGEVVVTPGNNEPFVRTTSPERTSIPQPTVSVGGVPNKTKDPEINDPATNPPVSIPPVTNPPITNPPITNPPITNPPVTNPPVTKVISPEGIKKPGLKGEYYDNMDFTELKTVRSDPSIDFRWGEDAPDVNVGADTFSVRWTGKIVPKYSENYTFYTYADDGARLWVNNVLIIDNWKSQRPVESTGSMELKAGNQYDIKLEYFENVKSGQVKLYWSSNSQEKEIIPESQLFHMADVYQAEQADLSGSFVENINAGYSGVGYVNYENEPDGYIEWKIETSKSGTYTLNFRYSNGTKANRTVEVKLNDDVVKSQLIFKPTGAWTKWQDNSITVHLNAGVNTIRVRATSSDGGPNIDYMELVR